MRLKKRPGWGFATAPDPGPSEGLTRTEPVEGRDHTSLETKGRPDADLDGSGSPAVGARPPRSLGVASDPSTRGPVTPPEQVDGDGAGGVDPTSSPIPEASADPFRVSAGDDGPDIRQAPGLSDREGFGVERSPDRSREHLDDVGAGGGAKPAGSDQGDATDAAAAEGPEHGDAASSEGTEPASTRPPLPRVIAVANQKGGVGKTTTTVNLGAALAELGYRVLVVDLDPQGNATTGLGIDARNFEVSMYDVIMRDAPIVDCIEPTSVKNLFVAPATIDLAGVEIELVSAFSRELKVRRAVDSVVDDFDYVLIDCPPSLGLITVNGLAAAREVLVPIQCEYYALEGLSQLLRNVHLVATNLNDNLEVRTIVLTMFDARTRLAIDVAAEVRQHFAEKVCRSVIPRTVRLSEAPSFGQPITVYDPTSRGAVAYRDLAREVSDGAPTRVG